MGLPGLSVLKGAGALVSIDARPLMLTFAICAGAAVYFSLPFEPQFENVLAGAGVLFLAWLPARRWWTSEVASRTSCCRCRLSRSLLFVSAAQRNTLQSLNQTARMQVPTCR
ncbi:MAG: hypothetical protein C0421_16735 [Hyphomonas sp.]|nr:hypothetical protein [Hyphomonas sp.]